MVFARSAIKSTPKLADSLDGATQNAITYTLRLNSWFSYQKTVFRQELIRRPQGISESLIV
jgi:hypothetical protein